MCDRIARLIVDDDVGQYRIQRVAELTGVPAATLRAWERRYGIPRPARSESAYRLYSARDVEMVRTLRDLGASGVAISQAVERVRAASPDVTAPIFPGDVFVGVVERLLAALRRYDLEGFQAEALRATRLGPAAVVYERVFQPLMREVGDLWAEGELSVAQEHLASLAVGSVTRDVARMVQPDGSLPLMLLACFEDEDHSLGMHGVAIRLASWGIRSVDLGARVPPTALGDAVRRLAPQGIALSITRAPDVQRARALTDAYADECAEIPWFVGGAAVAGVAPRVLMRGGVVIEGELSTARAVIERALRGGDSRATKPSAR